MTFPIFVYNSRLPVLLSKVAPISIYAINLGFFVFFRDVPDDTVHRHETIHYRQSKELLFVFFPILYVAFWLALLIKYKGNGARAYRANPFELEAYIWQHAEGYLDERPMWAWRDYLVVTKDEGEGLK